MNIHSIKFKVFITIILASIIVILSISHYVHFSYLKNIENITLQKISTAQKSFDILESNDVRALSATLRSLLINEKFKKQFLARNRDSLLEICLPLFTELRTKYQFTHWYFLEDENSKKCFLRIHNPGLFDDVVNRETYLKSIETKQMFAGKELGRSAFALRVVSPYFDNGKLIGYMELGQEITHFLIIMKNQTSFEYGLLIDKKYLNENNWESVCDSKKTRNNWNDLQNVVVIDKTTNNMDMIKFQGVTKDIDDNGMVLETIEKNDSVFVKGIFPVFDAKKQKVGGIFVISDITAIYNESKNTQYMLIFILTLVMSVITLVIILILNKLIFNRLDKMTDIAKRVVGGDYYTELKIHSNDEIGRFESLFEQFRKVFASLLKEMEEKE